MKSFNYSALLLIFLFVFSYSCSNEDNEDDQELAVVSTLEVTNIAQSTASSGGEVVTEGKTNVTAFGVCWSTNQNPTIADSKTTDGSGFGNYVSNITGLTANTTYYVRAYATNSIGTAYGEEKAFTTLTSPGGDVTNEIPTLTTNAVTNITQNSATSGGAIISEGGSTITAKGVCWSTNENPTIADNRTNDGISITNFTSNITGLTDNTTYYVRAYATNSKGTGYGSSIPFTTLKKTGGNISYGSITDTEGNTYKTVVIGTQTWTAENLKTTKYNDGSEIPNVTDNTAWGKLSTGAYCNYNNTTNADTINTYGRLYNWYAVNTTKLCPTGWHVPTASEWDIMENYLIANGHNYDGSASGNKIGKALASTTGWPTYIYVPGAVGNNLSTNNSSGFSALPGGARYENNSSFSTLGMTGLWWTSSDGGTLVPSRFLAYVNVYLTHSDNKRIAGYSIRCVKD